jgi:predicted RND superfamily exporter protein
MKAAWGTILIWVLVATASILLAMRMRPQTSIEGLLDPSDPSVAAMSRVLEHFPATEELLVMASLPEGSNDPTQLLTFAQRLEGACKASPLVSSIRYRAGEEMQAYIREVVVPAGLYYLNDQERADLLARLTPQGMLEQLQRQREAISAPGPAAGEVAKQLARDPLRLYEFLLARQSSFALPGQSGGDGFYSPSGRDLLIRISGVRPPSDLDFCREMSVEMARIAEAANTDRLEIRISGAYAIAAWSASRIRSDAIEGTIGTAVGLTVLLGVFLRRPLTHSALMLIPAIAGIAAGFGCYALLRPQLTPLSAVVGGVLGGIGIDYSIQFLARYVEERRKSASSVAAVRTTVRGYLGPLVAAWFTTMIGFASIAFSPIRLLRDFSLLGGLTLLGSFVATLTLLPALLIVSDRKPLPTMSRGMPLVRRFAIHSARRPLRWIIGMLAVFVVTLVVGAVGVLRWGLNSDLTVLHPRPNPPLEAQREIATRMGMAVGSVFVYIKGSTPEQLLERAYSLERRMDSPAIRDAGVSARFGLPSLLPDPQAVSRIRSELDPTMSDRVDDDLKAALGQAGFRAERFDAYMTFMRHLLNPGEAPGVATLLQYPEWARIVLSRDALRGAPATEAITLVFFNRPLDERDSRERALTAMRDATAGLDGVTLTGLAPITQTMEQKIPRDLIRLFSIAFILVVVYLVIYLRSIRLALVAMIPTAFSIAVLAAYIAVLGVKFNLVSIVMMPLLLGVNVDYGIYAVAAWRTSRSRSAFSKQFQTLTPAVVLSCVATLIGFGSLVITSLPAVRLLGSLIIVGITACLMGTVLLTWPLLLWYRGRYGRGHRGTSSER